MPLVSVIIPAFSRSSTIGRAIASVQAQTFSDYEIIVVDDASTDDTAQRVEALGSANLRLIRHASNRGAAAARNTGIGAARGRLIAFLDSDDAWTNKDKLALQVTALRTAGRNVRACASGFVLITNGRMREVRFDWAEGAFRDQILYGCSISPGSTLVVDRGAFDEIGGFDEEFRRLEDWDWLLRFSEVYDLTVVPDPLASVFMEHGQAPDPRSTLAALERLRLKHLSRPRSFARRQRLRGSLLVERAAVHYRSREVGRAVTLAALGLIMYPFRNALFFQSARRSLVSLLR